MQTTVLQSFDNYFSANIILTKLENEGIRCYLIDELSSTIYPALSNSILGIKLSVDSRQVERAKSLLEKYHQEYVDSAVCPMCKKTTMTIIDKEIPTTTLIKLFKLLSKKYMQPYERIYKCNSCHHLSRSLC